MISAQPGPASGTELAIKSLKPSSDISVRATPTMAKAAGRSRRRESCSRAGSNLRCVRSPEAPNTTKTPAGALRTASRPSASTLGGSSPWPCSRGSRPGRWLVWYHPRRRRLWPALLGCAGSPCRPLLVGLVLQGLEQLLIAFGKCGDSFFFELARHVSHVDADAR